VIFFLIKGNDIRQVFLFYNIVKTFVKVDLLLIILVFLQKKNMPKRVSKKNNNLKENSTSTLHSFIVSALESKKGEDITEMHFPNNLGMLFDTFVICSATSNVHANALCEHVVKSVKEQLQILPNHIEGEINAQWILIDYFHVIVHIFLNEKRMFYDLENLWNDTASIIRTTK